MFRKTSQTVAAFLGLLIIATGSAHAAKVALSIKFGSAGNIVTGPAGVDAAGTGSNNAGVFGNWNTMINKTTLNGGATGSALTAGNLILSNGAVATGVKVDGWKDAGGIVSTPSAAGFDLYTAFGTPTGSAGDVQLVSTGPRMNAISGAPSQNYGSIKLSGLSTLFPDGFTIRSYQSSYQPYVGAATGSGRVYVSTTASDFTSLGLNGNYATNAIANLAWSNAFTNFNNNYFVDGHFVETPLITGQDMVILTIQNLTGSPSNQFSGEVWNGIQIIGNIAETPEPGSIAVWSVLGLIGLVFGIRKWKAKA